MGKLVVVGTKRLTLPLTAVGFEPVSASDSTELASVLDRLSVDVSVALVVCGESLAAGCADAVARFRRLAPSVVLVVPDAPQPMRLGQTQLRAAIEQAAGVDLLGRTQNA